MEDALDLFAGQDGEQNAVALDLDGDGIMDVVGYCLDTDGDGQTDGIVYGADDDGDGVEDVVVFAADSDHDGVMDSIMPFDENDRCNDVDLSNDGDDDPDGETDLDEDDDPDEETDLDEDDDPDEADDLDDGEEDAALQNAEIPDWDPARMGVQGTRFDPESASDNVVGNPAEDMQYWQMQGENGPCAIYSQTFAFNALTGKNLSPERMEDLARANGIYTDDGTSMSDMGKLLEIAGLNVRMSYGNRISDIAECLRQGGKAVVSVDSDEIWYGDNDTIYMPQTPDHAVEVIGIQDEGTDHAMVILNDPGTPNGCGLCVPIDTFADAWEDSGCQMVAVQLPGTNEYAM